MRRRVVRLVVDPIACDGHGLCAELLPERIALDRFGFPLVAERPVGRDLLPLARRAARMCPRLALHLVESRFSGTGDAGR
jgi:ferredoxin